MGEQEQVIQQHDCELQEKKFVGPSEVHKWACELTLWFVFIHTGHVLAREYSEIVTLDAQKFRTIFRKDPVAFAYAKLFYQYMQNGDNERCDVMDADLNFVVDRTSETSDL